MAEKKAEPSITEQIDADEGLKSKRKLLVFASLVLLALSVSGAKIEEANTFILNIKFENQSGIGVLLVFSILFLMVRYFNYARPYHSQLYRLWSSRMLEHPYYFSQCYHSDNISGLVVEMAPKESNIDNLPYSYQGGQGWAYQCAYPFVRKIRYSWQDQHDFYVKSVFVGWKHYLKVLRLETKYQFESFFTHRENLDILAPYLIGFLSIVSFFFNERFQALFKALAEV